MLSNERHEVIADPYGNIAEFFRYADIVLFRKLIRHALKAADSVKVYNKKDPGDLLYEFKLIACVIDAAWCIDVAQKSNPLIIEEKGILNRDHYCRKDGLQDEWESFPRFLSMKEYLDPYVAFKRFFAYRKLEVWKHDLEEIVSFALSRYRISDGVGKIPLLSHYIFLNKLVEAAHLIRVRETIND